MENLRKEQPLSKAIINFVLFISFNILILSLMNCQDRLIVLWDDNHSIACKTSDVVLLMDTTDSMSSSLNSVKTMLTGTIIPGLSENIQDLQIGIATFEDIPAGGYGGVNDLPFTVVQTITDDFSAAQSAVNAVDLGIGGDSPESFIEALYLMSTNESLNPWFSPQSCDPDKLGAMCFREEATPIIIVITDSYTHEGPGGSNPYTGLTPTPHTYGQTIEALESIGAHVLGVNTGKNMKVIPDLVQLSIDSGGVDVNGNPVIVNLSSGANSGQTVVDLISSFCFVK